MKKSIRLGNPKVRPITSKILAVCGLFHTAGVGFGVNAGIILTSRSIIFIDAGMTIASGQFLWQVATQRHKYPENVYLILTHHHSDHVFGMRVMKEKGAWIIAHQAVSEFLENDQGTYKRFIVEQCSWDIQTGDQILGDVALSLPDQLITSDTVVTVDEDEIHLLVTPGHVPSEISIYYPALRTLFAGDTIYEGTPPTTRFGEPVEWKIWIHHLERLKELDIDIICPGHGELCTKTAIDQNIAYLQSLVDEPGNLW
jgi:glyoxylase-like metal-dependent hydrolase (beta-lactamase superfamily II)